MLPEQLAHGPPGRVPVAVALHQYVEHRTVLVHRVPQPVLLAVDRHDHLSRCHLSSRGIAVERMRRSIPRPNFTDRRRTGS